MKRLVTYAMAAVVALAWGAPVAAQQPGPPHGPGQPPAAAAPEDHQRMMDMCRQMMGHQGMRGGMGPGMRGGMGPGMMGGTGPGTMEPGMMGMMPMTGGDPKQQAEMMAMRGEMLKAMGDIMIKYAQRVQPPTK